MEFTLEQTVLLQSILENSGISSIFTGDIALIYHGVDVALHVCCFEGKAIKSLADCERMLNYVYQVADSNK